MHIAPLEQFANPLLFLPLPIVWVGLTKISLYGLIAMGLLSALSVDAQVVGSRWSVMAESLYHTISGVLTDQLGQKQYLYLPLLSSLFALILCGNLLGNVPYGFAFTSSLIVCMGLSVIVFIGVTVMGAELHGISFMAFFVPTNAPLALVPLLVLIETVSYVARAFSLGVRLLANVCSGHMLLNVFSSIVGAILSTPWALLGLLPLLILLALFVLEVGVSVVQAYVFALLMTSYLNDSISLH